MRTRFILFGILVMLCGGQALAEAPSAQDSMHKKMAESLSRWTCPFLSPAEVNALQTFVSDDMGAAVGRFTGLMAVPMDRKKTSVSIHRGHYHTGKPNDVLQGYDDEAPAVIKSGTLAIVGVDLEKKEVVQLWFGGPRGCEKDPQFEGSTKPGKAAPGAPPAAPQKKKGKK